MSLMGQKYTGLYLGGMSSINPVNDVYQEPGLPPQLLSLLL